MDSMPQSCLPPELVFVLQMSSNIFFFNGMLSLQVFQTSVLVHVSSGVQRLCPIEESEVCSKLHDAVQPLS